MKDKLGCIANFFQSAVCDGIAFCTYNAPIYIPVVNLD